MFLRFCSVGFLIYGIDYFFFYVMNSLYGFLPSRIISYTLATFFAYKLNSFHTFQTKKNNLIQYFMGSSLSGIQNILLSYFIAQLFLNHKEFDFLFIGIGCFYGLIFNYFYQKHITFK